MKKYLWLGIAPAVCLALFWRAPFVWFTNDDFAWLGLRLEVHDASSLFHALFDPAAQGTIRVFSERLFFLLFSSIFGLHALPFRLWGLLTWFAELVLAALIGARLAKSRAAGVVAAVLWTASWAVTVPLIWSAAYNDLLCGVLMLAAFYARLRWLDSGETRWRFIEWAAYLTGFGALEVTVMYPLVALAYTQLVARRKDRQVWMMFVPAALFAAAHFLLIPKTPSNIYKVIVDSRMPSTLGTYVSWALGAGDIENPMYYQLGVASAWLCGLALAVFLAMRRDRFAVFSAAWFFLFLAPVLPLPNHISDYYLSIPLAGFGWLGGLALTWAWRAGTFWRVPAVAVAAVFFVASAAKIESATAWNLDRASHMRLLVRGAESIAAAHPGTALLLEGASSDLFESGINDDPFRLLGIEKVYVTPGTDDSALAKIPRPERFRISTEDALHLMEHGQARALDVSTLTPRDVTARLETVLRAEYLGHRRFVDVGNPGFASSLGGSWFTAENGFRWMSKSATVRVAAPSLPAPRLYVTGFGPALALASGPVTLRFSAGGVEIGSAAVTRADQPFAFDFPIPASLPRGGEIEILIEVSRTFRPPGDIRDLGMIFGTFSIH